VFGLGDTWMHNVLVHETLHIALKHCTVRARDPHELWNIATRHHEQTIAEQRLLQLFICE
jgi:predicted metal-dependent peptidase